MIFDLLDMLARLLRVLGLIFIVASLMFSIPTIVLAVLYVRERWTSR